MIVLVLLVKMIACSTVLYGYYLLFLRNKRFHHYNRFYLLAATALSIIIPFIRIPVFFETATGAGQIAHNSIAVISVSRWEHEFSDTPGNAFLQLLTVQSALMVAYSLIVVILTGMLWRSLFYIFRLSKKYPHQRIDSVRFYNTVEPGTPFSFFKSIFWNDKLPVDSKEGQQIFRHELFHVQERHSADVIFLEAVTILFWINPVFHLIKKEIKAIHEFLADQHAVSNNNTHDYAELLIVQTINLRSSVSNYFFQNHIKRRIAMITQLKDKKYGYVSRLLVLPLLALLFCVISVYAKHPGKPKSGHAVEARASQSGKQLTILVDAGHGGTDAGARSSNGLQEKDLALAIARQVQQHASAYNVKALMTRTDDTYPSLKERTEQARSMNADLIVSIHIGAASNGDNKNGFDLFVTSKNAETIQRSKVLAQNIASKIGTFYTTQPIKQRKEQGIWILDGAPCPAVLIECGYLSNEKDAAFVSNVQNQEKIARSILEGIASYQLNSTEEQLIDTIPATKKMKDQRQVQLKEEKIKESERQHDLAKRKLNEHQREREMKQRELQEKQKRVMMEQLAVQEEMARGADKQRDVARMQKELQTKQQVQESIQQRNEELQKRNQDFNSKQKNMEERRQQQLKQEEQQLRQRQLQIENKKRALLEKQEELEEQQLHEEDETGKPNSSVPAKPQNSSVKKKPQGSKPGLEKP